jgi:AhpD family alkylhydroperoxidase
MSLVPDEVRTLHDLSDAHYLPMGQVRDPSASSGALNRMQMELIAGRISALRQCFYWTSAHSYLLRASGEHHGTEVNLSALTDHEAAAMSGVEHGAVLIAFAEAIVKDDDEALVQARQAVIEVLNPEGMVDAAGVASNFERMVRIADATGIPLDERMEVLTKGVRDQLQLERFTAYKETA